MSEAANKVYREPKNCHVIHTCKILKVVRTPIKCVIGTKKPLLVWETIESVHMILGVWRPYQVQSSGENLAWVQNLP